MLITFKEHSQVKEIWAVVLSNDGQRLAGTTHHGHIKVWDLSKDGIENQDIETKGSFGMCIDMVSDNHSRSVANSRN